jgi:hypothetical protein
MRDAVHFEVADNAVVVEILGRVNESYHHSHRGLRSGGVKLRTDIGTHACSVTVLGVQVHNGSLPERRPTPVVEVDREA